MTITHRFVILNRKAVKNLRPSPLRAGEDTRPYERNGLCLRVGEGISALLRLRAINDRPCDPSSVICSANATFPQGGRLWKLQTDSYLLVGEGILILPPFRIIDMREILHFVQNDNGTGSLHSPLSTLRSPLPALHPLRGIPHGRQPVTGGQRNTASSQKFFCNAFPFVFVL